MNIEEIAKLPKYEKSTADIKTQISELIIAARKLGLFDAADAVEKRFENLPPKEFGCFVEAYLEGGVWQEVDKTCVMDDGEYHNCVFASKDGCKEQCEYWRETTFLKIADEN